MSSLPRPLKWPPIFPLEKGLVLWLPLDERSGNRALDRSGKGRHVTLYLPVWVAAKRGTGLYFNGLTNYGYTANNVFTQADFQGGGTLEILIMPKSFVATNVTYLSIEGRFHLSRTAGQTLFVGVVYDTAFHYVYSNAAPSLNTWYHLALVFTGSALYLYVNGVLQADWELCGVPTIDAVSRPVMIAANTPTTLYLPNIVMKYAKVYLRALTAAEIKRHYESELLLARH